MTVADVQYKKTLAIDYGQTIETEITRLGKALERLPALTTQYRLRWLAIQLLEGDESLSQKVESVAGGAIVLRILQESKASLERHYGDDVDVLIAERRYQFVNNLAGKVITYPGLRGVTLSDKIDRIVTHRLLGIPIFLALMWVVFKITTDVAAPLLDWVDAVISGPITNWTMALLEVVGLSNTWLESLIVDGIIAGVGGVLVFVPVLMSLYFALALLEDSGYMARAAFVMDRLMQKLGLHGKSFMPMVVGFGCTVPAIYATRTLDNERDRILTALLVPFMSCGARLPVYVLFAAVFFPGYTGIVIFGLYLLGIATAVAVGLILKGTLFKGAEQQPFVMELPPYRIPTWKSIWHPTWVRMASFIRNAWTIILLTSIVVWSLMAIPVGGQGKFADTDINNSLFAVIAGSIAPLFAPLGFGSPEAAGSLITGFVAKEVVVSTLVQTYNAPELAEAAQPAGFFEDGAVVVLGFGQALIDTVKSIPLIVGLNFFADEADPEALQLIGAIQTGFNDSSGGHGALAALAFMVFVLLYTPCMVTVAAMWHELGPRWTWFSMLGQFALAWVAAAIVFQGGLLLGFG